MVSISFPEVMNHLGSTDVLMVACTAKNGLLEQKEFFLLETSVSINTLLTCLKHRLTIFHIVDDGKISGYKNPTFR